MPVNETGRNFDATATSICSVNTALTDTTMDHVRHCDLSATDKLTKEEVDGSLQ
jgi:hypothetical protein